MKKIIVLLIALILVFSTACSSSGSTKTIQTAASTMEITQTTAQSAATTTTVTSTAASTTTTAATSTSTIATSITTAVSTVATTTSATTTTETEAPAVLEKITLSMPNGTEISADDKLIVLNASVYPKSCETKDIQIVCTPDNIISIKPSVLPVTKATYIIEPIQTGKVTIQAISGDGAISSEPLEVTVSNTLALPDDVIISIVRDALTNRFHDADKTGTLKELYVENSTVRIVITMPFVAKATSSNANNWKEIAQSIIQVNKSIQEIVRTCGRDDWSVSNRLISKDDVLLLETLNDNVIYNIQDSEKSSSGTKTTSTTTVSTSQSATIGESNALKRAKEYLRFTAFSYSGLIDQLEYEKYSHTEAVYGADNCGADWNEQALKKANSYLSFTAFSYKGLIEQLEYEGFTHKEAEYGADNCGANWKEQAAKKAASYLKMMSFSKSKLIEQLEYEGFTHEQAVYGVEKNGL